MDKLNTEAPAQLIKTPGKIFLIFFVCFCIVLIDFWKPINVYNGQSSFDNPELVSYYSYLPALFNNDGSFKTPRASNDRKAVGKLDSDLPARNYGMAILYTPFYFISQVQVNHKTGYFGYSQIHAESIHWGAFVYLFLGLVLLRKFLLVYFTELVVVIVSFISVFGTILFYYSFTQSELPECHLFFLFVAFLRLTQLWHEKPSWTTTVLLSFTLAIISLIYISDVYIFLFFLLWNIRDKISFKSKRQLLSKHLMHLLVIFTFVLILWIPQLIFNYDHTGQLFYFTNQSEWYDFSDSKIYTVLFSYSYGWITYSPVILLAIAGIFFMKKQLPLSPYAVVFILLLVLLITGAWRGNDYYGARRLCASIAWLSLPLAIVIAKVFSLDKLTGRLAVGRIIVTFFFLSCVFINLGTSYRVKEKLLVPAYTTGELYWKYFKTYKFPDKVYDIK